MDQFIDVEEARDQILAALPVMSAERVLLSNALGRILARDIIAPEDAPRFDNSAMDGFALRAADLHTLPARLEVLETISAGTLATGGVSEGQAMKIMTGAPLPQGADTVVPRELCQTPEEGWVLVNERPSGGVGANIRRAGSYMRAGHSVMSAGSLISPAEISTLASFQKSVVDVARRPVVAIVSTGDELVELGTQPGPGKIVNSNAYMLEALVRLFGGVPLVFPIARDDREQITRAFEEASHSADIVVSSGGVSVGDFDFVKVVLDELTGGMNFWKIRLKPGKPLAFGTRSGPRPTPFIGLPGNPASSFVGFHLFLRPALAISQGVPREQALPRAMQIPLAMATRAARGRTSYVAGRLEESTQGARRALTFMPFPDQSSGNATLFCGANAMGILDPDAGEVPAGTLIDVISLTSTTAIG